MIHHALMQPEAVSGVAIGFLFAGMILPSALPSLTPLLPWILHPLASMVALQQALPDRVWLSVRTHITFFSAANRRSISSSLLYTCGATRTDSPLTLTSGTTYLISGFDSGVRPTCVGCGHRRLVCRHGCQRILRRSGNHDR